MIYDLSLPEEAKEAADMLAEFQLLNKKVEIKVVRNKRSLKQNAYLHLILSYMALETGYTLEEAKSLYKQMNKEIYYYFKETKDGNDVHEFIRSSRDLDEKQMSKSIEKLHMVSAENGVPLPLATDQGWLREIERAIEMDNHLL